MPPKGLDPVFGLSRGGYYALEKLGFIRLVRIRKPGNQQGRTLVDCASVRNYFAKLARTQTSERATPKNTSATSANDKTGAVETAAKTEADKTAKTAAAEIGGY